MNKHFELGEKVFAFDMINMSATIAEGIIAAIEISNAGHLQYRVKSHIGDFLTSPLCIGHSLADAEAKLGAFNALIAKQKEMANSFFGKPEFDIKELTKDFPKVEKPAENEIIEPAETL